MDNLPQDPIILYSYLNTMLRDRFSSLDELCESLDLDKDELVDKLKTAGFEYMPEINQFR